jgi:hypothetical protein
LAEGRKEREMSVQIPWWLTEEEELLIRNKKSGMEADICVSMINATLYKSQDGKDFNALRKQNKEFDTIIMEFSDILAKKGVDVSMIIVA